MTDLGKYLIAECIKNKSKRLDLGNCGLEEWPDEVCEMDWLEELNFRDYSQTHPNFGFLSRFQDDKWEKHNESYRMTYALKSNNIKRLPFFEELLPLKNLKSLCIGGHFDTYFERVRYWELNDVYSLKALEGLVELRLSATEVSDISIVEGLHSLRVLELSHTAVSDLSAIAGLEELECLDVSGTEDIAFESRLIPKSLKQLFASETGIRDLAFVSKLAALETLDLSENKITRVNHLSSNSNLKYLRLSQTSVSDLRDIRPLSKLRSLWLDATHISGIIDVSGLEELEDLDISINAVTGLKGLSVFGNLKRLILAHTELENLSIIEICKSLEKLDAAGLPLHEVNAQNWPINLRFLDLSGNQVSDFSSISSLRDLKDLNLSETFVADLSWIEKLEGLQSLDLAETEVKDISVIKKFKSLKVLQLYASKVEDLSSLAGLTRLQRLNVANTQISDLSPLQHLLGLEVLHLEGTKVSELYPIRKLLSLKSLSLDDTLVSDLTPIEELLSLPNTTLSESEFGSEGVVVINAPLKVPPPERVGQGLASVLSYFEEKRESEKTRLPDIINEEAKLVVLGNSTVGKSSLLKYLTTPRNKRRYIDFEQVHSTHGLQKMEWEPRFSAVKNGKKLNNLCLTVLDFGGQEYYHDCHHLFFTNRTAYLVLWDEEHNRNESILTPQKLKDGKVQHRLIEHHNLEYWLDAIGFFVQKRKGLQDLAIDFEKGFLSMMPAVATGTEARTGRNLALGSEIAHRMAKQVRERGLDSDSIKVLIDQYGFKRPSNEDRELEKQFRTRLFEGVKVLVVQNKIGKDRNRIFLNRTSLLQSFPFIQDFAHIDIHEGIAMEHLEMFQIKELIENLPVIGDVLPGSYKPVNHKFNRLRRRSITISEFEDFYTEALEKYPMLRNHESFKTWRANYLQYKIDTGKWLHYSDTEDQDLQQRIFIKPFEVIDRFYAILNDKLLDSNGKFTHQEAKACLAAKDQAEGINGNEGALEQEAKELLALMQHFHIVFEMEADENFFVAPQYLSAHPHKSVSFLKELLHKGTHRYAYEGYIHKSVVLEFFSVYGKHAQRNVPGSSAIGDYFFWKDGIVIKKNGQIVMVEFDQRELNTYIRPQDNNPEGALVQEVMDCFDRIHEGRKVRKEVSVDGVNFAGLRELNHCAEKNIPVLEYANRVHRVADYRAFIDKSHRKKFPRKKVFISYSKTDIDFIEELRRHLKPLEREGQIDIWYDRDIHAGVEWDEEIKKNLSESDIVLMMVSSDFINTDYIWHEEIPVALDQHETKQSKVIPIILRDCLWEGTPLAKLHSPRKGKSIKAAVDRDEAWTEVARAIQRVVKDEPINPDEKAEVEDDFSPG